MRRRELRQWRNIQRLSRTRWRRRRVFSVLKITPSASHSNNRSLVDCQCLILRERPQPASSPCLAFLSVCSQRHSSRLSRAALSIRLRAPSWSIPTLGRLAAASVPLDKPRRAIADNRLTSKASSATVDAHGLKHPPHGGYLLQGPSRRSGRRRKACGRHQPEPRKTALG